MSLTVFHGLAAEEGDYVIIAHLSKFYHSSFTFTGMNFCYAKVHNNKAYAAKMMITRDGRKWLRVRSKIMCVVDSSSISKEDKELIELNMNSASVKVAPEVEELAKQLQLTSEMNKVNKKEGN